MKIKDYLNQDIPEPECEKLPPDYQEYLDTLFEHEKYTLDKPPF